MMLIFINMYIIDKLQMIKQSCDINSNEYRLSDYLLSNISTIENNNLKQISIDTKISNATITRFCQKIGYKGVVSFLNDLYLETKELNEKVNSNYQSEVDFFDIYLTNFLNNCDKEVGIKIDILNKLITNSKRIMLYGKKNYIDCFENLVDYSCFSNKKIYTSYALDKKIQETIFNNLKEDDLLVVVEPNLEWDAFKEISYIQDDMMNNVTNTKAKIVFIGQPGINNVDLAIFTSYAYCDYFYKVFLSKLDLLLLKKLWGR